MASRTTRRGEVDGVAILAVVTGGGGPPRLVLEKQFRPPQGSYVIEARRCHRPCAHWKSS